MRYGGGATAAQVLGHAYAGVGDLAVTGLTAELFNDLNDLVNAGGACRVAPGF